MSNRVTRFCEGSALIITALTIAIIGILVGITASFTINTAQITQRSIAFEQAMAVADASLELAYAQWRQICRANARLPQPTSAFANINQPTAADFHGLTSGAAGSNVFQITNYGITAVDPTLVPENNNVNRREAGTNENTNMYSYLASVAVTVPTRSGPVRAGVSRIFRQTIESPWSYAIFFESDLEMHPGPPQRITGPVHTNGKLYAAHSSLTYDGRVTTADEFINDYAPGDKIRRGSPRPTSPNYNADLPPTTSGRKDALGINPGDFNTADANPNNDGYREIVERPVTGHTDPLAYTDPSQRLYSTAALKILIEGTSSEPVIRIFKGTGNNPVEVFPNSGGRRNKQYYAAVREALTTGQSISDFREVTSTNSSGTIGLTTLDVGVFMQGLNDGRISDFTSSSVIHFDDARSTPAGAGEKHALRLANGRELPAEGLTVAANTPVYIQGDYNTGFNPETNTSSAVNASPTGAGYDRKPAAIVADAVNILSNSWNDANSTLSLSQRRASHTTVNAGILSGNVTSKRSGVNGATTNTYSGGAENFPRFLEDWNNIRFSYYGSMIQLFESRQATGVWGQSNVYNAPNRNWFFDVNFRTNPPPGFLVTTMFERGLWRSN